MAQKSHPNPSNITVADKCPKSSQTSKQDQPEQLTDSKKHNCKQMPPNPSSISKLDKPDHLTKKQPLENHHWSKMPQTHIKLQYLTNVQKKKTHLPWQVPLLNHQCTQKPSTITKQDLSKSTIAEKVSINTSKLDQLEQLTMPQKTY